MRRFTEKHLDFIGFSIGILNRVVEDGGDKGWNIGNSAECVKGLGDFNRMVDVG